MLTGCREEVDDHPPDVRTVNYRRSTRGLKVK